MNLDRLINFSSIKKSIKRYKKDIKKTRQRVLSYWQKFLRETIKKEQKIVKRMKKIQQNLQKTWRKYEKESYQRGEQFYKDLAREKKKIDRNINNRFNIQINLSKHLKNYQIFFINKSKEVSKKINQVIYRYLAVLKKIFPRHIKQLKPKKKKIKSIIVFSAAPQWQLKTKLMCFLSKLIHTFSWNKTKFSRKNFYSIILTYGILGVLWQIYVVTLVDLPSPLDLTRKEQAVSTRILDRNGNLLFRIYEDENRTLIPLSDVPEYMVQATVAIEDQNFFTHHGFSIRGIVRAFIANLKGESLQGGSTITQQLVKNRLLSSERTFRRKIRELLLSVLVEGTYSKEEILQMYFNQVPYGGATYGIEEAAWRYFNKSAKDLTLAESALLAGLPQSPSIYSPFGSNPELAFARQEEVLRRMVEDGYITESAKQAAQNQSLNFKMDTIDIRAPHFVMYVKKLLAEQFGEELLNTGGLEVRTTLDLALQNEAQQLVTNEVNDLARLRVQNGAALVTNPQTGEILSMVGSKDYFDFEHDGQVNVTLRPRQPGSSIKPLTYALALERGQNPGTMIEDAPITYHIPGSPSYSPQNYDGKYHGKVSIRQALASSYNIPAVKTLATIGVNTMLDKAEQIGFTTWQDRKRFGLSLTLGGGEVLMTEMAQLYGTFANSGYTVKLNPILEVRDYKGKLLYRNKCVLENTCERTLNFSPKVAYQITDILSDNNARTPAFGPRSVLYIPNQQVAVKTGTTNNLRDNWTIGYTTNRLVAVWVGNNDNTSMSYVASGVTGASPIWNNIMRLLLNENEPHYFAVPEGLIKVKVCAQTGTLPCKGCPTIIEELFEQGQEPRTACNPAFFKPKPTPDPNRDKLLEGAQIEVGN